MINFLFFLLIKRKIIFFLNIQNQFLKAEDIKIYIAIPENVYYQKILDIKFNPQPDSILKEEWGQNLALFKIKNMEPYEEKSFKMEINAIFDFKNKINFYNKNMEDNLEIYLRDDPYLCMNSDILKKVALNIKKKTKDDLDYIKDVLDTISKSLFYSVDGSWQNAEKTFLQGHGSCSEYSFLFSSLMRLGGLPTRFVGGTMERKGGIDLTFHRWVEVFLKDKGWIPVDAQYYDSPESNGKFFPDDERLFLVTTITPSTSSLLDEWYNFNVKVKKGIIRVNAFFKWEK
ncbi:MAG: transglutaminase-like domain-containing protein [candidate division WOR-3 bacterium]